MRKELRKDIQALELLTAELRERGEQVSGFVEEWKEERTVTDCLSRLKINIPDFYLMLETECGVKREYVDNMIDRMAKAEKVINKYWPKNF